MRYTVIWVPSAKAEPAQIWSSASDRATITAAADEIDRLLKLHPFEASESRDGGKRIILIPPLGALFRVYEADRVIRVASVWQF
jgi:hypothetical protein